MDPELPPSLPSLLLPLELHRLRSTENNTNDDDEAAPSSNRPFAKKSRGAVGSHGRFSEDEDDDDDYDDNKGLDEDDAAGNEELVAHGWATATSKNKTKKTAGKKGAGNKGVGGGSNRPKAPYTDWKDEYHLARLEKARSGLAKLRKAEAHLKRHQKTTVSKFCAQVNIPKGTFDRFVLDPSKFRKRASETDEERAVKHTSKAVKDKQASGSLSNHPKAVYSRDYSRKIVYEGYVPTRGPRKMEPVGGYSMNVYSQGGRKLRHKTIAKNVAAAAATDMVIKEGDAF